MTKPIILDAKSRRMWAARASDASSLLSDVIEFIVHACTRSKWIGSNKKEVVRLMKIHGNVTAAAINLFSTENSSVSATFGAYYRARQNSQGITITQHDYRAMASVVRDVCDEQHLGTYLENFTQQDRLTPKDAHIALLKSILFDKETRSFLAERTEENKKYFSSIELLIQSVFNILEFIHTPFAVLATEACAHKESTSAIDLQWGTMQKALLETMQQILNLKQDLKIDQNKKKKETAKICPPRMTELFQATKDRLAILAGSFGVENAIFTEHLKAEAAVIRHEQLVNYFIQMHAPDGQPHEVYDPQKDYRPALHAYVDGWAKNHEKLQQELAKVKAEAAEQTAKAIKAAEEAQKEIKALKDSLAATQAELDKLRESHPAVSLVNEDLRQRPQPLPSNQPYDESFYVTKDELERIDQSGVSPYPSPKHDLQPQLSVKDLEEKRKFLAELSTRIIKIENKKYDGDNYQERKLEKLRALETTVTSTFDTTPLKSVISAFNEENYDLISSQRRTKGFLSLFNPKKPDSQKLIDKYCPRLRP